MMQYNNDIKRAGSINPTLLNFLPTNFAKSVA
jgi:hypothetical protein